MSQKKYCVTRAAAQHKPHHAPLAQPPRHSDTQTHTHTCMHTYARIHTRSRTHAHTYTNTYTHAHTYTCTRWKFASVVYLWKGRMTIFVKSDTLDRILLCVFAPVVVHFNVLIAFLDFA